MTPGGGPQPQPQPRAPAVSVIIACYDAAAFLEACVGSVLGQTLADLEVLIVDDRSSDDSPAIARRLATADRRVRAIAAERNGGPGAARNLGFGLAGGRWLAIIDSDDLWHPDRLARLVAEGERGAFDIVADDLLVFDDRSPAPPQRFLLPRDHGRPFELDLDTYLRRSVMYGSEPNLGFLKPVIRRSALVGHGLAYNPALRIAEDDDLVARMLLAGMRYRVLPDPLYFYRKHGASISHRLTLAAIEAMIANARDFAAQVERERPAALPAVRARIAALEQTRAFEIAIAALKRRRPDAALAALLRAPAAAALFRLPIRDRLRRLLAPTTAATPPQAADRHDMLTAFADRQINVRPVTPPV